MVSFCKNLDVVTSICSPVMDENDIVYLPYIKTVQTRRTHDFKWWEQIICLHFFYDSECMELVYKAFCLTFRRQHFDHTLNKLLNFNQCLFLNFQFYYMSNKSVIGSWFVSSRTLTLNLVFYSEVLVNFFFYLKFFFKRW